MHKVKIVPDVVGLLDGVEDENHTGLEDLSDETLQARDMIYVNYTVSKVHKAY